MEKNVQIKKHNATQVQLDAFERNAERAQKRAENMKDAELKLHGMTVSVINSKMNGGSAQNDAERAHIARYNPLFMTVSLPVSATCAHCIHYVDCYAKRGRQASYSVQASYYMNLEYFKRFGVDKTIDAIMRGVKIAALTAEIEEKQAQAIRFFAAGDCVNADFYGVINGVAERAHADLKLPTFGFTRQYNNMITGAEKYGRSEHLNMILSNNGFPLTNALNPHNAMQEFVLYSAEDAAKTDCFICPGNCTTCGAYTEDGIAYCVKKRAQHVAHIAH